MNFRFSVFSRESLSCVPRANDGAHRQGQSQASQKWVSRNPILHGKLTPYLRVDIPPNVCAAELSNMLGCWAATGDVLASNECQAAAETLFQCMRTAVSALPTWACSFRTETKCIHRLLCSLSAANSPDRRSITISLDWASTRNSPGRISGSCFSTPISYVCRRPAIVVSNPVQLECHAFSYAFLLVRGEKAFVFLDDGRVWNVSMPATCHCCY